MADIQGEEIYLSHSGQEIDDCIDEVTAARGGQENLSAAIGEKADFADVSPILTAFPLMMRRGEATMNSSSGFGFDDIHETIYYRYTASAIGNPIENGYGLIITFFFTSYGVQFLISKGAASSPARLLYRFSSDTGATWQTWREVTAEDLGGAS